MQPHGGISGCLAPTLGRSDRAPTVLNGIGRALGRAVTNRQQARIQSQMASQTVADFDIYEDVHVEIDGRKLYATVVTIEGGRIEVAELATGARHWISPTQALGM
jgi:hypothetical protein